MKNTIARIGLIVKKILVFGSNDITVTHCGRSFQLSHTIAINTEPHVIVSFYYFTKTLSGNFSPTTFGKIEWQLHNDSKSKSRFVISCFYLILCRIQKPTLALCLPSFVLRWFFFCMCACACTCLCILLELSNEIEINIWDGIGSLAFQLCKEQWQCRTSIQEKILRHTWSCSRCMLCCFFSFSFSSSAKVLVVLLSSSLLCLFENSFIDIR